MRVFRALSLLLLVSSYGFAATPDRITGAIDSSRVVQLARSLHPKAQPQYDQGAVDPQLQLSYVTLLASPSASQQKALDKLLADQQDPASSNYHRWLTPAQYGERFGLSQNDLNKITAWLKTQGITVRSVAPGRNSIIVSGTAAQFESAFQTEIHRYNVEGKGHVANATPLKIPAALSGIVTGVRGLHDFRMKAMGVRKNSGIRPFYTDSQFFALLAPDDIATIYDIKPLYAAGFDGTGQKLAVVGQTDIYLADINDFRSGFGLSQISGCTTNTNDVITACSSSSSNLQYIRDSLVTDPGTPNPCGDLSEADLDIEWAGATARNAQIIYVNSPATFDSTCTNSTNNGGVENALSIAIQQNVAPVVSMSYGICELMAANHEAELQQANAQGMTIVNSTGDEGAAGCDSSPPGTNPSPPFSPAVLGQAVSYPASSPEVTGVGGTSIPLSEFTAQYWAATNGAHDGTALSYIPEVTYNDDVGLAVFCQSNPTNAFCMQGGKTAVSGWVPLTTTATAQQVQEDIWIVSTGGGPSNCFSETAQGVCTAGFTQPSWQKVTIAGVPAARFVPDVALMSSADFPGYIICTAQTEVNGTSSASSCAGGIASAVDTFQSVIGGTSAATPVVAGMVAILNQYFQGAASAGLGNINPMLYKLAAIAQTSTGSNGFNHVNTGTNQVYCQTGTPTNQPAALQCPAGGVLGYDASVADAATGYNLVTGLGSIDLNKLATAWAATAPNFLWTSSDATHTVMAGQTTLPYHFTATPAGAATTFGAGVTFSCSFSPADATLSSSSCTFSPASIAAGTSGATAVSLTIKTTGPNTGTGSALQHRADKRSPWLPLGMPIAGMVMVGLLGRRVSKPLAVVGLCVSLTLLGLLIACGGGHSSTPPPAPVTASGTYTVTVTATEAGVSHAPTVAMVVQ